MHTEESRLISAAGAAKICGRSRRTWWRLHAAEKIPASLTIGGGTVWKRAEILAWIEGGCPSRAEWEALKKTN
jgi:predicted DNA-binding transcriptional regulator AlpA